MKVRCKFLCQQISEQTCGPDKSQYGAELTAFTDGSEETAQFFAATPWGKLELGVLAGQYFKPGKAYYIDIYPADEEG